jgi:hypothetical protein
VSPAFPPRPWLQIAIDPTPLTVVPLTPPTRPRRAALLAIAVLNLSALAPLGVMAHGVPKAKHGGVIAVANDLGFELVSVFGAVVIYVDDHGTTVTPTGMSGKLTVTVGSQKFEADLAVAGDRLEARGVKLATGATVVATLTNSAQKTFTVKYKVK